MGNGEEIVEEDDDVEATAEPKVVLYDVLGVSVLFRDLSSWLISKVEELGLFGIKLLEPGALAVDTPDDDPDAALIGSPTSSKMFIIMKYKYY